MATPSIKLVDRMEAVDAVFTKCDIQVLADEFYNLRRRYISDPF